MTVVSPLAAMALGRALREAGLPVTPDRSATFPAAAALLEARDRDGLYWAARFAFVTARDQLPAFDAVFAALVDGITDPGGATRGDPTAPPPARAGRHRRSPSLQSAAASPRPRSTAGAEAPAAPDGDARTLEVGMRASEIERLTQVRLDELDQAEFALVARLVQRLALATPPRRARRARASRRGEHLDVRATLRRSRRTAGDPVAQLHRRRRERPRPLVALLDVSGSMAPYARAYLLLLEGAARGARAEAFVFATRLTRVTKPLREGRAHAALERASAAAPDWAGGTRLGESLRTFNDRFARRGLARDAVVVVLSDGWERADPALVGREMERLARLAYRIVWVNPRVAAPGFAPATGGMAAALPHVDELVSGHTIAALDAVVEAISRHR
ncbi:MAG TPA: VWA domain-containing protein [Solirubrobacteraceae bacterium]|nr:VWA domain-containing protein [Solirubrobacteraceae bacterium]